MHGRGRRELAALSPGMARHRSYLLLSGDLSSARKSDDARPSSILTALPQATCPSKNLGRHTVASKELRRYRSPPFVRPKPRSRETRQRRKTGSTRCVGEDANKSRGSRVPSAKSPHVRLPFRAGLPLWVRSWSGGWTHRPADGSGCTRIPARCADARQRAHR